MSRRRSWPQGSVLRRQPFPRPKAANAHRWPRKQEKVDGQAGEGPSETETTHSPEGRQAANREYRDLYKKYARMSEAALNSEPIPLGHRQTIRRYFELIRPQGDEAEKSDVKPSGASAE